MAEHSPLFRDPRRRNLAVLAIIAIVSVLLAALALMHQVSETGTRYANETFFPGLPDRIRAVTRIHIASKAHGAFDMVFDPNKGWVLPQRGGYPASFEQMRSTVVGLAALQTIEPKTSRPEWYKYIGVDAPPAGDGTLIQLFDEKGNTLAALIAGKSTDIGDATGAVGLFVRKPGEAQSWLVRSVFEPKSDPADWLDKTVLDVDRARVAEVDVTPVTGLPFAVKRDRPGDTDFTLENIPKGRELAYPGAADAVGFAVAGFSFDDVRPVSGFDFTNAPRLVTKTFDGLTVTVRVLPQGQAFWVAIYAEGGAGEAAREAHQIDAHTDGWAYKLHADKGQLFMTTLDSLLNPLPAKK